MNRRDFLKGLGAGLAALFVPAVKVDEDACWEDMFRAAQRDADYWFRAYLQGMIRSADMIARTDFEAALAELEQFRAAEQVRLANERAMEQWWQSRNMPEPTDWSTISTEGSDWMIYVVDSKTGHVTWEDDGRFTDGHRTWDTLAEVLDD